MVIDMKRVDPTATVMGPNERGVFVARWREIEGVHAEGRSPEEARRALFDALVEQLRRGIDDDERARLSAFRQLSPAERTRRATALYELTWSRE